jgi:hypothetical protein
MVSLGELENPQALRLGVPRALPADDYAMRPIVTTAADYVMARVAM